MTYGVFEQVLADMNDAGEEAFGEEWFDQMTAALEGLAVDYHQLTVKDRVLIDYSALPVQGAYSFAYSVGRSEFLYQIMCKFREALGAPIFGKSALRVASLGGGPGSEFPGLLKYLDDPKSKEAVSEITYQIFDKCGDWDHLASLMIQKIADERVSWGGYAPLDLTDDAACNAVNLAGVDVVIMSFLISEICAIPDSDRARKNIAKILQTLSPGAIVVYNDSMSYPFYSFMNSIAYAVPKLEQLHDYEGTAELDGSSLTGEFQRVSEATGRSPHMTSRAVAKLYRLNG